MKTLLLFFTLSVLTLSAFGQGVTITYVGTTTGSTLPGATNDFIFFNQSNYPVGGPSTDNVLPDSHLSSFYFAGGVNGANASNTSATINSPLGTPIQTGELQSHDSQLAFAIVPTGNANFNYNDFNVYYAVSTTGGSSNDLDVGLDSVTHDTSAGAGYGSHPGHFAPVVDNSTGSNTAQFVEFNVQGFGSDIQGQTGTELLVGSAIASSGPNYISAISFEAVAVPEPSTYAMMLGGMALLGICVRRKLT